MDVRSIITQKIIDELEKGYIPWENPRINSVRPQNIVTGNIYKGINQMLVFGSDTPYFMTFKQGAELGAKLKKGAKAFLIVFWSVTDRKNKEVEILEDLGKVYILKYYNVFKLTDWENVPQKIADKMQKVDKAENNEIQSCENIILNMLDKPEIKKSSSTPCYIPLMDEINIDDIENFKSSNAYYSTLFHELTHSTGHEKRLNRFTKNHCKNKSAYAYEELIADLGASYLMAEAGETVDIKNRSAYIQSWLHELSNDKNLIITASTKAEKAVDFILNIKRLEEKAS